MGTYASMLRGVNVGGRKVEMEKLRRIYESMGFRNVWTYIQSGNVVFECPVTNPTDLSSRIEKQMMKSFGFDVPVFIRTENEILKIIENNPFAKKDTSKIHTTFLSDEPKDAPIEELGKFKAESEDFAFAGKEIYLFCPYGYGGTKLSNTFFEKKLKLLATTRNWRTVNAFVSAKAR